MKHKESQSVSKSSKADPANTNIHMKISEIQFANTYQDDAIKGQKNVKLFFSVSSDSSDQFFNSKSELRDDNQLSKAFVFKEKFTFQLQTGFESFTIKIYASTREEERQIDEYVLKIPEHLMELID